MFPCTLYLQGASQHLALRCLSCSAILQQTTTHPAHSPEFARVQLSALPTRMRATVDCVPKASNLETPTRRRQCGRTCLLLMSDDVLPSQETYGDISGRLLLREKLKCQHFNWYLKNIYPDLHVPEDRAGWHGAVSV